MNKFTVVGLCLLMTLPFAAAGATLQDEALKHWRASKEFTIAVAEMMPADGYDFKPNPEEMSFGELMIHMAFSQGNSFARASETKSPLSKPDPKDKAAVIKLLNDSFDFALQTLENLKPEQMERMSGKPGGPQSSGREILWSTFTHIAHHRGQAEVYLRVKNIKPPQYRF